MFHAQAALPADPHRPGPQRARARSSWSSRAGSATRSTVPATTTPWPTATRARTTWSTRACGSSTRTATQPPLRQAARTRRELHARVLGARRLGHDLRVATRTGERERWICRLDPVTLQDQRLMRMPPCSHLMSNDDGTLLVGDGCDTPGGRGRHRGHRSSATPILHLFDLKPAQTRRIARHDSSWKVYKGNRQVTHPHPSFTPDGAGAVQLRRRGRAGAVPGRPGGRVKAWPPRCWRRLPWPRWPAAARGRARSSAPMPPPRTSVQDYLDQGPAPWRPQPLRGTARRAGRLVVAADGSGTTARCRPRSTRCRGAGAAAPW
jgi:hypothetical protein